MTGCNLISCYFMTSMMKNLKMSECQTSYQFKDSGKGNGQRKVQKCTRWSIELL